LQRRHAVRKMRRLASDHTACRKGTPHPQPGTWILGFLGRLGARRHGLVHLRPRPGARASRASS
jgi:hypothetical protein